MADPDSHSTNSINLGADHAKSCCSSITVSNTLTVDSAILCDTQWANEKSGKNYLNDISLEYENIARKWPPLNQKLTKIFQDLIWNNTKPKKLRIF